jgi:UDP-N-acetylglucosamine--N-acetylmuramyl-(pentapeptide) pyrophosphoryl-undecaprenol N-acetylglucosamine transferase
VFPALAIKQALAQKAPNVQVIFAGTAHGFEAKILTKSHEILKTIWISGFSRRHPVQNILLPLKLVVSFFQSLALMLSFRPQLVIGTGGYVMGPVLWTAQCLGIPTLLQEQNSHPGYTTRKLAKRAAVVCLGFADAAKRLTARRVEVTGNPLRTSFKRVDPQIAHSKWNLDSNRKTILIFGGSAGAQSINRAVAQALPRLLETCNVLWQTGKSGVPESADPVLIQRSIDEHHLLILEFIDDMAHAYAAADVAICRAGAMTLAELAMIGVPAILVPYPFATDDHQTANAKSVADAGGAIVLKDADLTPDTLFDALEPLISTDSRLTEMGQQMNRLARSDAAYRIADIALTTLEHS